MIEPIRFLNAFGKSLAAMALYGPKHPARANSTASALEIIQKLQQAEGTVKFSFLGEEVVFQNKTLKELRDWDWSDRLTKAGIQRVEFVDAVPKDEFEDFLHEVMEQITPGWKDPRHLQQGETKEFKSIRYGAIGIKGDADQFLTDPLPIIGMNFPLDEEVETISTIYSEVAAGRPLPAAEVEAVVSSLSVAMHGDSEIMMPLLQLKEFDQYTTAHSLNVSVLVMGLAEFLGLGGRDTRAIGVAGLLRDVGMTRVPKEIVAKAAAPTEAEWELIKVHPVEGAKIILQSEPQLDLAAVVAFEHHMLAGGGGYPKTHFERDLHFATKLVQVCDCYDALRTRRFHRGAWTPESALNYVEEKAGSLFDADIAKSFLTMMRRWERRILPVDEGAPVTPPARGPSEPTPAAGVGAQRGTPSGGVPRQTPRGSGAIRS